MSDLFLLSNGARRFRDDVIVADGHSDLVVDILRRRQNGESSVFQRRHAETLKAAGIKVMMLSTGGDGPTQNIGSDDPFWCTSVRIQALLADFEESAGAGVLCRSMTDVDRALSEGKLAALMMIEGASPLRSSLECLDLLYRLGLRSVQLTWNARNLVGDGCGESLTGSRLTLFGKALVREMNRKRMLVDLSHASEALFYSVAETASAPFIVSHANARTVCDHVRNLTDDQIRIVAERGGLVGLCFFPWFIDPERPSVLRLLDHLDHIAQLVGINNISLGADFIYYARDIFMQELTASDRSGIYSKGFEVPEDLAAPTGVQLLAEAMSAKGYSDEDIVSVLSGNLLRLYREVMG